MRIACLQFAPQVGEVDNNLNRADAVLAKANQDEVDSLDLLVLPELAFSGHNFGSYEEIAPYLEPSGSGISSLWARTIALKHNTNVLVGYPEQVDASGNSRAGPKQYNSTILVNGDGETVANYRKAFLHPLDESWAREGKDFFGNHVPGLGTVAIGIAIINMAWFTNEECEQFTQFPNEPDMETLAYWARRLEPIIRDESRDELIIVFCNRTGIEDQTTVYAGTSAVIGIHQGEVKVYGLLGRGVKELLIVDTDEPPFANLTIRKDGVHLSPMEYELKTSEHSDGAESLLFKPSPIVSGRRTPTKCFPGAAHSKAAPKSLPAEGTLTLPVSKMVNTPATGCPGGNPSKDPSPASTSARPRPSPTQPSCTASNQVVDLDVVTQSSASTGQILGGSVEFIFENDEDALENDLEQFPSTSPCGSPLAPSGSSISQGPQQLGTPHRPTILAGYPGNAKSPILREPSPRPQHVPALHERCIEAGGSSPLQGPPDVRSAITSRPSTATGIRPPRPASPKSQNARIIQGRSQSVAAESRGFDATATSRNQRLPDSRSMSRSGRIVGLDQGLIERALDFYLGSQSVDIRDRIFAIDAHMPQTASVTDDEQSAQFENANAAPLGNRSSSSDSSAPYDHSVAAESDNDSSESRTVLWQEDSQIIGQHLRRTKSKEGVRGRRQSRDTKADGWGSGVDPSTSTTQSSDSTRVDGYMQSRNASRSQTSRGQYGPTDRRASPSRFRPSNGDTIRTIRDPSLGPPSDSEDEIIAEITFRRPACRNCGSSNCGSKGATRPKTQDNGSDSSGPAPDEQNVSIPDPNKSMPPSPPAADSEKTPTINKYQEPCSDPLRLALRTTGEDINELRAPNLSRASLRTLSSYEPSPVTPPPRHFEPRTPKAMVFNSDYAPTPVDPVSNLIFDAGNASLDNIISMSVERPKVSV
ncbi:hypothetical protein N0V93_006414 [Gnomoniopsis smithogilvyi]|uniref:CN hydrolase domain-containing protein n=1 Tax=Gnomoniopsis smithogilvyi TaxID=1191159 RepID=A0A9W8YPM8_9PEZI|nr:hypothetical protein N0V93_006414 [Gnomoniopsis smithogilvyi]